MMHGFDLYHINATIYTTNGEWSGARHLPTFYVLGGTENDAEVNARKVIGVDGALIKVTRVGEGSDLAPSIWQS